MQRARRPGRNREPGIRPGATEVPAELLESTGGRQPASMPAAVHGPQDLMLARHLAATPHAQTRAVKAFGSACKRLLSLMNVRMILEHTLGRDMRDVEGYQ